MNKLVSMLTLTVLIGACTAEGEFTRENSANKCDGTGQADITVSYGDSLLDVTPKVKVKQDGEIIVKLKPEKNAKSGINYETLEIELVGEKDKDKWLNLKVKASDFKKGTNPHICVKKQALGDYKYLVKVPGVGTLDPRAVVEPR